MDINWIKKSFVILFIGLMSYFLYSQDFIAKADSYSIEGYKKTYEFKGNINDDYTIDYAFVFDQIDLIIPQKNKRLFCLLISSPNGYRILQNSNLLYYFGYDENFNDSLVDIKLKDGLIEILQYGGFSTRWGLSVIFQYNKQLDNLIFKQELISHFDSRNLDNLIDDINIVSNDKNMVLFSDFNIYADAYKK